MRTFLFAALALLASAPVRAVDFDRGVDAKAELSRLRKTSSSDPVPDAPAARSVAVARLVVDGATRPEGSAELLRSALERWPAGLHARFLITPGGFLWTPRPAGWSGRSGWDSTPADLAPFIEAGRQAVQKALDSGVLAAAKGKVDYLTLAVDVGAEPGLRSPHAELVAVVDAERGSIERWTGKSYPLAVQEDTLVEETDMASHLFTTRRGERVLVLGCHDLNVFNPRGQAALASASPRRKRSEALRRAAADFAPNLILQHPHATDSPNIWRLSWSAIPRLMPGVRVWASAIAYFNYNGGEPRASLESVLKDTKSGDDQVVDLVVRTR